MVYNQGMDNIIKFKKSADKEPDKGGKWVPYEGRDLRVWQCECGSTITQVVENLGTQCVFCEKVIIPL